MAVRARSIALPVALLVAALLATLSTVSFVQPARVSNVHAGIVVPAAATGFLPLAASAVAPVPEQMEASSLNVATQIEVTMLGLLLGLAPVTALGLFVAAWLQFKKSPTLGV
eukprot:TRINITY_DN92092_c0_g1_i1.p2 TRINITY_DN92092_c0_g1~~TRINITY_DN92092_c0_g1_i1.p2  ORF type:complete len:112 (+),score=32.60 TRINITY_DN92092_c0_g1_i1:72-407(+)